MDSHRYLSPYLTKPATKRDWGRLRPNFRLLDGRWQRRFTLLWHYRPRLSLRSWAGLGAWAVILVIGMSAYTHQAGSIQPSMVTSGKQASIIHTANNKTTALAAKAAAILPDGPTGQLLPPGTMAPFNTFTNGYAHGQCTWYAASRRPVPGNWGNARTWYGRAQAAGWAVGATPAVAAIAWTSAGYYGHVAVVEDVIKDETTGKVSVLISEMNYTGLNRIDKRWVDASAFKYIY
jgi:surface antigen